MDKQAKDFEKGWEEYKEKKAKAIEEIYNDLCWICEDDYKDIAKGLVNAGYRKIPEGAVVFIPTEEKYVILSQKEYKRFERIEKIIKLAKMERANGYEVKNGKLYYFTNMLEGFEYEFKDLQEICDAANHYDEELFGLQQRLDFWKCKAEETRKETAEKFAEMVSKAFIGLNCIDIDEWNWCQRKIDEICKEITEGKA
jgi:hypothetical protein